MVATMRASGPRATSWRPGGAIAAERASTATLSGVRSPIGSAARAALLALALPLVTSACYSFAEPSLRPGDSLDVMAALARHGAVVTDVMSGESACDDRGLVANALHVVATAPDDPTRRDVFIYLFRVKGWEDSAEAVDACQDAYADSLDGGALVQRVDVPTYRAFGADWSNGLTEAITDALEEASTKGE